MSRQELCLKLAHRAFAIIEREHKDLFMSDLEIFTRNISAIDLLPANLIRLAELNFNNLDAPTALMRASTAKIENLVSVCQSRSSKLCFVTVPEAIDWPAVRPALEQPIEEVLSEPIFKCYQRPGRQPLPSGHRFVNMGSLRSTPRAAYPSSAFSTRLPHQATARRISVC